MKNEKKTIVFFYPRTTYETGQQTASRLILEGLKDRWQFCTHSIPSMCRSQKLLCISKVAYVLKVLCFWGYLFSFFFRTEKILYFNIGQSWNSIIRDGLALLFIKSIRKGMPLVISLHGNWFTQWQKRSRLSKTFLKILSVADMVTVLDSTQKVHLINSGFNESKIKIVPNTCQITPASLQHIEQKHFDNKRIKILYLSNLIESKGYRQFLSMLKPLSAESLDKDIDVTICGSLLTTGYSSQLAETEETIQEQINNLNKPNFKGRWIKSVAGQDKNRLFKESHIFVFPSQIEAQPIVVLEAMASGSAIIASKAGLIPNMIDRSCGILLKDISPNEIYIQTKNLIENYKLRAELAKSAIKRYNDKFSISAYTENWNNIFTKLND